MERPDTNDDWLKMLEEYEVEFLVVDPHTDSELLGLFRSQPGWAVDFEDREAIIFARTEIS